MASRAAVTLVFVVPAVASVGLAGAVMAQILAEPGRAGGEGLASIVGLAGPYEAPASVSMRVEVGHAALDCGDVVIEVLGAGGTVAQGGFFGQCFGGAAGLVPVGGPFEFIVEEPGEYEVVAEVTGAQGRGSATATGVFTVS